MTEKNSTARPPLNQPVQGRLNLFQQTLLDWNDLHPYNEVHGVQVSAPLDPARLHRAIHDTLEFHGLTGLTLNRKKGTFQYAGGPVTPVIKTISAPENPPEALRAEIEWQVNTPFDSHGEFQPFRYFVVTEKTSFSLGLVYFHAVADAVSIVRLLMDIYHAYLGQNPGQLPPRFNLRPGSGRLNPLRLVKKLAAFPAHLALLRRCVRAGYRNVNDGANRFEHFPLPPETLRALLETAKAWNVTLNDLFIAVLLRCCAPGAAQRLHAPRRRRLAIGCIVNTRSEPGLADPAAFGLFLGSFIVAHETPNNLSLEALAADVNRQTRRLKQRKDHVGTSLEMLFSRWLPAFFSTERRKKLYQKHYPLRGGVTNLNLNSLVPPASGERPANYFRGVSTGPVTPLVLSVTTIGNIANIGLTFRATAFPDPDIEQLKNNFIKMLADLNSCP